MSVWPGCSVGTLSIAGLLGILSHNDIIHQSYSKFKNKSQQADISHMFPKLECNYDVIQFVQHRVFNSKLEAS